MYLFKCRRYFQRNTSWKGPVCCRVDGDSGHVSLPGCRRPSLSPLPSLPADFAFPSHPLPPSSGWPGSAPTGPLSCRVSVVCVSSSLALATLTWGVGGQGPGARGWKFATAPAVLGLVKSKVFTNLGSISASAGECSPGTSLLRSRMSVPNTAFYVFKYILCK